MKDKIGFPAMIRRDGERWLLEGYGGGAKHYLYEVLVDDKDLQAYFDESQVEVIKQLEDGEGIECCLAASFRKWSEEDLHWNKAWRNEPKNIVIPEDTPSEENISTEKDRFLLSIIKEAWDCVSDNELMESLAGAGGTDPEEVKKFYPYYYPDDDNDDDEGEYEDTEPIEKDIKALFKKIKVML